MTELATVYIGLGSNLNEPAEQIQAALDALSKLDRCSNLTCAPWYRSQAIGPAGQPDYINTVARLTTQLSPLALLRQLQNIEDQQGRQRTVRWGARTLDLGSAITILPNGRRILLSGIESWTTGSLPQIGRFEAGSRNGKSFLESA